MMRGSRRGFTLLEILITLVILGLVAGACFPVLADQVRAARSQEAIHTLGTLKEKVVHYYQSRGNSSYAFASTVVGDPGFVGYDPNSAQKAGQNAVFTYTLQSNVDGEGWVAKATEIGDPQGSAIVMNQAGVLCGEQYWANRFPDCSGVLTSIGGSRGTAALFAPPPSIPVGAESLFMSAQLLILSIQMHSELYSTDAPVSVYGQAPSELLLSELGVADETLLAGYEYTATLGEGSWMLHIQDTASDNVIRYYSNAALGSNNIVWGSDNVTWSTPI